MDGDVEPRERERERDSSRHRSDGRDRGREERPRESASKRDDSGRDDTRERRERRGDDREEKKSRHRSRSRDRSRSRERRRRRCALSWHRTELFLAYFTTLIFSVFMLLLIYFATIWFLLPRWGDTMLRCCRVAWRAASFILCVVAVAAPRHVDAELTAR